MQLKRCSENALGWFARSQVVRYGLLSSLLCVAAFGQCTFTVSPTLPGNSGPQVFVDANGAIDLAGDPLVVQITASAQTCAWTADASDGFATVDGSNSGTGNGSVTYTIPQNPSKTATRSTTLNIAGNAITLTQDATVTAFQDVLPNDPSEHFFFDGVNFLAQKGVAAGISKNPPLYGPQQNITRGQMAVFIIATIYNAIGNFAYSSTPYFTDVPPSNPFFKFVQKMRDLGIAAGTSTTTYSPDSPVTRAQMAVFITLARLGPQTTFTYSATPLFSDVPANNIYFKFVQKLAEIGITAGCVAGNPNANPPVLAQYCPNNAVTRDQMAVFLVAGGFNLLNPAAPVITSISPNTGSPGATVPVTVTGINTHFDSSTTVLPTAGVTASTPTSVTSTQFSTTLTIPAGTPLGPISITTETSSANSGAGEEATLPNGFTVGTGDPAPAITSFAPTSGPIGTQVTIAGTTLVSSQGIPVSVLVPLQGGGTTGAPVTAATSTSLTFVVPSTATTGNITVSSSSGSATSTSPFTVTPSSTYTISASPSIGNVIAGQSTTYTITASSSTGFTALASLSLSGLPSGLTDTFNPAQITAGQQSTLTITAPSNQASNQANLAINASATVDGIAVPAGTTATLNVTPISTSFIGRTVVDNSSNTSLVNVTINMVGQDGSGNKTGCTGSTASDGSGNFALTNLPSACLGPQLVAFNGSTVTSPPGSYAGLQLVFTLVSNQVVVSPVLVHLPPINTAETFNVIQNDTVDQSYTFTSIPGLSVTVYAGTVFTEADGSQPNPFPLAAVEVPVDRLPDVMPTTSASVTAFIVAFQPAESNASQEVAVWFPNTLNTPPGTDVPLMTLDPTKGRMVPYGTGTVSSDGTTIIPDIDPSSGSLQHRYGIVHFDWHGPAGGPPPGNNPGPCGGKGWGGDPVDLSSGLFTEITVDMQLRGLFPIMIQRTLRNGAVAGNIAQPFGTGGDFNYDYRLDLIQTSDASVINLIMPDGNRYPFNRQADGTLINTSICTLRGAVMTTNSDNTAAIAWPDGSNMTFIPGIVPTGSLLNSWSDKNNNTLTFTRNPGAVWELLSITNASGLSLNFTYDGSYRITQITDPLGRTVNYTYNNAGYLASVTHPDGATWKYTYDSNNNIATVTDPRNVVIVQNTYDANGRVTQQIQADGSVVKFAYTLINSLVPTSPVQQTVMTDQDGHSWTHRFSPLGYTLSVVDPLGNERDFTRASGTNFLLSVGGNGQCPDICGKPQLGNMTYTYDSIGNLLSLTNAGGTEQFTYLTGTNSPTSVMNALGDQWSFGYDGKGNVISESDPAGGQRSYSYAANGTLTQAKDELGNVTTYTYNANGNLIATADPDGNTTQFGYDAVSRLVAVKDPKGQVTQYQYDAKDRLIRQTNPNGQVISFTYDPVGNIATFTDPRGNVATYTYDVDERLTSAKDPDGNSTTYTYDAVGNILTTTDRRGSTTTYAYDALNRRVSETYADGATVARQFDAPGRVVLENDSVAGVFQNQYDAAGNLVKQTTPFGSTAYTRDAIFEVTSRQVAGQNPVNYTFDARGYVSKIAMGSNTVQFTYDARGGVTGISRSNGITTTNVFDPVGNITSVTHANGGTTLDSEAIGYDPLNYVVSASRTIAQALTTPSASATYDAANRVTAFGSRTITSDNNGNRLTDAAANGTTTYTWDARNRLVGMIVPASGNTPALTVSYLYDPEGNLIRRRVTTSNPDSVGGDVVTQYLLDENSNVIYQGTVNGEQLNMLTGFKYDQQYGVVGSAGTLGFALHDYLGSVVGNTDSSGNLAGQNDYEPFGQTTQTGTAYPFAFSDRIQTIQNLYNFRARYYDPTTGSFISEDPAGLHADFNFYRYVNNNPVTERDPLGQGFSFGGQVGGIAEGGVVSGGSVQASGGAGVFFGGNGVSGGAWGSAGGFAGVPGAGGNWLPGTGNGNGGFSGGTGSGCGGAAIGAVASAGGGVWASNAGQASDLGGVFNQFNFNAGVGPVKIGFSFAWSGATTWWNPFSGTWIASVSPPAWGATAGIGASFYKTNTWGTAQTPAWNPE